MKYEITCAACQKKITIEVVGDVRINASQARTSAPPMQEVDVVCPSCSQLTVIKLPAHLNAKK